MKKSRAMWPEATPIRSWHSDSCVITWPFDGYFADDEHMTQQPGNFYGGWTSFDLAGSFKESRAPFFL